MNSLAEDLDNILAHTDGLWEELKGNRIFITGGTGFFGCWLLESFIWANEKLGLSVNAVVLSRDPEAFYQKAPHLANHPAIKFHTGDVRDFSFPEGGFSHIIHAATEASAKLNEENPLLMIDSIVHGTRRSLDFALHCGAKKLLFTSSGAVYGKQPSDIKYISEDYPGGPNPTDPKSAYSEGKRIAELLCNIYSKQYGLETKIARCFTFVGPYLPLDSHYAIGNFISDVLNGRPIQVKGDGTPYRSYLYAADMAIWLWTILFKGKSGVPYNVGSDYEITIAELAQTIASVKKIVKVEISKPKCTAQKVERYVPDIKQAQTLGLYQSTDLREAIDRTIRWYLNS